MAPQKFSESNKPHKGAVAPPPPAIASAPTGIGSQAGPPPPRHAAHRFYAFPPGAVPFDPTDRGAPGPYTTAQYEKYRDSMAMPPRYAPQPQPPPPPSSRGVPATNSGSPNSQLPVNRPREAPPPPPAPHPRYPPPPIHGPQERHPVAPPSAGAYPQMERRAAHWPSGARFPPPTFSQPYPHTPGAEHVHHAPAGPYRYSDSSLRREAISRLSSPERFSVQLDDREGATSPSQIESSHREEVTTMGCTCKKTKCLKLYCQCFAVKIYCGTNCRCLGCYNTPQYEKERKEAIRSILQRNPTAFDTKFKKSSDGQIVIDKVAAVAKRAISHKLGCKCRKSACVKKYCECYAGGVKCSANCRCVGCKNMPIGGFGNGGNNVGGGAPVLSKAAAAPVSRNGLEETSSDGSTRPTWMMNAAQNLAFLKHASPSTQKAKKRMSIESNDMGSMPSLASASEGSSSPSEGISSAGRDHSNTSEMTTTFATATKEKSSKRVEVTSSEKTAISALLMAAGTMTDLFHKHEKKDDDAGYDMSPSKPTSSGMRMGEDFETPQKLVNAFSSPKRKQGDRELPSKLIGSVSTMETEKSHGEDASPKRDYPGNNTPHSTGQKLKRSRVGSTQKLEKAPGNGFDPKSVAIGVLSATNFSTPNTKGGYKPTDLTPVTARCIDFRNMHVNETNNATENAEN